MTQPLSDHMVPAARSPETVETQAGEFGAFYERWHAQLHDYVKTTCGARDAEEITQETFARALVNLDLSRDPARQWRWLRVVARNVATDLGRSRRLCDVASDAPCDMERVATINIEQQLLDSECLQELHHVLTALSPKQSQAWWLTIAEGMSPTAIAATLDCSPESVRQALFKTRRKLASAMAMFCERAEGFGAVGVLAVIARRIRHATKPVARAATPAPLALAAASVVGTLAFLSLPAHFGDSARMPATAHPTWHAAADSVAAHSTSNAGLRRQGALAHGRLTSSQQELQTRLSHPPASAWISDHPLSQGKTITVQAKVDTPVGEASFETTFTRTSQTGILCHRTSTVTCS